MDAEQGDPACWLDAVCPECGRIRERPGSTACEHCGFAPDAPKLVAGPATSAVRDRDQEGRARNARPRDGLGRPLPYGVPGVERQPEGVPRTPDESLVEAQRLLDAGMPFHAHEVLEDAWKMSDGPERELWRGMAQLAVGLTHAARGNTTGGAALLRRGARNIAPYLDAPPHGIDIAGLGDWAAALATTLDTASGEVPLAANTPRLVRR
ncbi:hypothetical protein CLV43_10485 [Umezawaea tangerina]|uniref:DUF309 family protein family protein n=1 Tax=Umezawaea tangerina TaxID=84725 RepID=A0A2T0T9D7_9PSEU|nr:hypothetical protein CLV43_10485 [Umezawaea tangerina]